MIFFSLLSSFFLRALRASAVKSFSFSFALFALLAVQTFLVACGGSTQEATPTPAGVTGPALLYFYTDN